MIKVLLLALCATSSFSIYQVHSEMMNLINSVASNKQKFKLWQYAVNRQYDLNSEFAINRYKVFKQNMKFINQHNNKNFSYKYGLGPFTDLTNEEFKLNYITSTSEETPVINHAESHSQLLDFDLMAEFEEERLMEDLELSVYLNIEYNESTSKILRPLIGMSLKDSLKMASNVAASLYDYYSPTDVKSSIQQLRDCSKIESNTLDYLLIELTYWKDKQPATDEEYNEVPNKGPCKSPKNTVLGKIKEIFSCNNMFSQKCHSSCSIDKVNSALKIGPYGTKIFFTEGLQHYAGGIIEGINVESNFRCNVFSIVSGYEKDTDVFYVQTLFPNFPIMQISVSKNAYSNPEYPVIALGAGSWVVQPRF